MIKEVKGIVIKTADYKDADKIVTILTENLGKISAGARGVRRKGSHLAFAVQPFTYCTFQLFKNGKNYVIDEADVEMQFSDLSNDIQKIALASYFCELCAYEMENETEDDALLRLVLNSIYAVEQSLYDFGKIKAVFELKCVQLWGYNPSLRLEREILGDTVYISHEDGSAAPVNIFKRATKISKHTLMAIKYIQGSDFKRMFSFKLSDTQREELCAFAQDYLLDKIEYKPKTLSFYESL